MDRNSAETLALQALAYIAAQDDQLARLVGLTGLSLAEVRGRAGDPDFLAGVLDFLLSDEALLLAFCADQGLKPEMPQRARLALPGGRQWTDP